MKKIRSPLARHLRHPRRAPIPHHACLPFVRQGDHAYAYCRICGRAMKEINVRKLLEAIRATEAQRAIQAETKKEIVDVATDSGSVPVRSGPMDSR